MWYKGTEVDCENYNAIVTQDRKYKGETENWSPIIESESEFYIQKYPKIETDNLTEIENLPEVEN